jgi:three-Cys-motif partner protein
MVEHRYGGPWTEIKLDVLESYLTFYATALKNQPFELWYVDAFAGSGDRVVERLAGGLFEGVASHHADVVLDGSAKKALNIQPPFQRLVFIEDKARRFRALLKLKASHPDRRIECFRADANALVRAICDADHWRAPTSRGRRVRAVVFLDPYGMQVEWKTLQAIRDTRAVDLLYLFPIGPVLRQAAIDLSKVDQAKEDALTRLYGGNAWRQDWYKESPQSDWLQTSPTMLRNTTKQQIESGFKARLETLFPYVSEPLPLLTTRGAQLFSLFLAVSNQAPSAIALAKRAVGSIMRASRR